MRLITTCPACTTSFFVRPVQLDAHRGDVRCGKCSHVFNALDRLAEVDAPPLDELQQDTSTAAQPSQTVSAALPTPTPAPAHASAPGIPARAQETPGIFGEVKSKGRSSARRRIVWPYYVFALLLVMIGALQTLYFLRTPISTQWPGMKPLLTQACDLAGCKVDLPRNISQLVIDDSDLQEDADHEDVIRLSTLLINNAPYAQAYPLLELTLTDKNDHPVLRRAFTAAEYLPKGRAVEAGIPAGDELQIKLALTSGDVDVSGYRVYLTYP